MSLINDGYGSIEEMSNPRIGTAKLRWRPVSMRNDKDDSPYALPAGWNQSDSKWNWRVWIEITCKEWSNDEKPPFSWFVTTHSVDYWFADDPINAGTKLVLFVGPHVAVVQKDLTVAEKIVAPTIQIIRLDSTAEVPQPGETVDLGQMLGDRPVDEFFYGMPRTDDYQNRPKPKPGDFDQSPHMAVDIVRTGLELIMTKRWEYWQLKIKLSDVMPSFFRIVLMGIEMRYDGSGKGYAFHRLRVYHSPETTVDFTVDVAAYKKLQPAVASVETVCVPFVTEARKRPLMGPIGKHPASASVDDAIVGDNYNDMEGVPKGGFQGQKAATTLKPLLFENGRYKVFSLFSTTAIGFIPVVGQIYDVADCICIAMTGEDLWGSKKTKADIALIAGLGILGGIGDVVGSLRHLSAPELRAMDDVGKYVFPNATLISKNPNIVTSFARASFNASNAALRRAAQMLSDSGEAQKMLLEMQTIVKGDDYGLSTVTDYVTGRRTIELEKFGTDLAAKLYAVMRKNADTLPFEEQPQILQIVLKEGRDLLNVAEVNALDAEKLGKLKLIFNAADEAQNAQGVLKQIAAVDSGVSKLMEELVLQKVKQRLKNHPTLRRRYVAYVSKHGKTGTIDDFVETSIENYIAKKATGQALDFFELIYGADTLAKLKGGSDRLSPAQLLEKYPSYIKKAKELLNDANLYWKHRDEIERSYPGLGRILNSDHILEKRLRKMAVDGPAIDHSMFTALLVPADHEVAKVLAKHGVDVGWYIHVDKTRWLHELLPQGREGDLLIENVVAAYQYFWVHKMGASHETFKALVEPDLKILAVEMFAGVMSRTDAEKHVQARMRGWFEKRSEDALRLEVDLFRGRMRLDPLAKTSIGNRVTTSPDL